MMIERRRPTVREWQDNISVSMSRVGARVRAGEGFIYIAEVSGTDLLKIGFSLNPEERVKQLCARYGREFRLMGAVPASRKREWALHRHLNGGHLTKPAHEFYRRTTVLERTAA